MLSNAPGKGIQFEKAPFKLTNEFVDVIGGVHSANFSKFRKLLYK
jgi:phosphatidylinositol 4-kinase